MKKIYTVDALKFGFATFFKNPLFFLLSFLVSKIVVTIGFLIGIFFTFPFFINFMKTFVKIFKQAKELVEELTLSSVVKEGVSRPLKESIQENVIGPNGFFGDFFGSGSSSISTQVVQDTPGGALVRGLGRIAEGVGDTLVDRLQETKILLAEILQNKLLFAFFVFGLILLIIIIKMAYDFVMLGWTRLSLEFYDKKSGSIQFLFSRPNIWITYVLATVIFLGVSCVPSLIYFWFYLLISYFVKIPNIILMLGYLASVITSWCLVLRFWFYPYYIIDENAGVIGSLKKSYNMGLGFLNVIISLFAFAIIAGVPLFIALKWPHIITFAILGVILAVVWMSSWVSYAYLYRKLKV